MSELPTSSTWLIRMAVACAKNNSKVDDLTMVEKDCV
jgi:hypothetical protein